MFAYCFNNPIIYEDQNGYEGFVGFGLQFDVSTDHGTYGAEVVIYLEPSVVRETTIGDADKFAVVGYSYSGISVNVLEMAISPQIVEMVSSLDFSHLNAMAADELLITLSGLLVGYDFSGSVFAIYGYDNFESANSYSGKFSTYSAMGSKPFHNLSAGAYYSFSDTCWAVGIKLSGSTKTKFRFIPIDIQYSHTFYSDPTIYWQG